MYNFVPINRVFSKLIRDLGGDFDEGDVVEWTGEALEFIAANRFYEEAIAFIEVKNHQCDFPTGLHSIIQIARNNMWRGPKLDPLCPQLITNCIAETEDDEPSIPVALDCNGEPVNAYDLAYYRPYFDLKAEYGMWSHSSYYTNNYSPVRLKNHSFFNSLVCQDSSVCNYGEGEYTIVNRDTLRFNFKEGSVAIAYLRQRLDEETGYPMIPDNISYTTAIVKYITLRVCEKQFYAGREGSKTKLDKAEGDWHWYCKQASNVDMMPNGIDEHQNLLDQRSYILPRQGQYFGFFGNLSRPENRLWNKRFNGTI